MKESTRVLVGLLAALVIGSAIALSGNPRLLEAAAALVPVGTLWINAIRMTVIPLVVALLITGVASAADLRAIGRLGGRTLLTFFLLLLGTAIVIVPFAVLAFSLVPAAAHPALPAGAAVAAGQLGSTAPTSFGSWLSSLLPGNPFAAAAEGAMLPLFSSHCCSPWPSPRAGTPPGRPCWASFGLSPTRCWCWCAG